MRYQSYEEIPVGTIVYKKANVGLARVIVKMITTGIGTMPIPDNRKCRVESATVLSVYVYDKSTSSLCYAGRCGECDCTRDAINNDGDITAKADYDDSVKYKKGLAVKPIFPFNNDLTVQCGSGIHCFLTEQEAEDY